MTYNILLDAFGKNKDTRGMQVVYQQMVSQGIQPDIVTASTMVDGFSRTGEVEEAIKFITWVEEKKIAIDLPLYHILMTMLMKQGKGEEMEKLIQRMKDKDCHPGIRYGTAHFLQTFNSTTSFSKCSQSRSESRR